MLAVAVNSAYQALLALLPLFVLLVVVAILALVLLGGFLFSTKSLEPKFERMNPLKGVARMFSAQTMVELIKTLAKASVIGRSEEHTSELQSLMRISYAVFCLK